MNIFVLDDDPAIAAQMMCDKHIPKMVTETFQMLGSALRRHGATDEQMPLTKKGTPLVGGYKHHPATKWAGETKTNFVWLCLHGRALCQEYQFRFGKTHSCHDGIDQMCDMFDMIPNGQHTPYAQCMEDEYRCDDAVDAYRQYYIMEKAYFAKWEKGRQQPSWWPHTEMCNV